MAAGQWFVRELRSSDTPDELRARARMRLTPELERARYQLVEQDDHSLRYRRRYLPTGVMLLGCLLAAGGAYSVVDVIPTGHGVPWLAAALGIAGFAVLAFVRRAEVLTVTVMPRPGGSEALLAGHANERARIALRTWTPPIRPNLRCVTHSPPVPSQTARSRGRPEPRLG